MLDLLLVNPPGFSDSTMNLFSALPQLSAWAAQEGYQVGVLDLNHLPESDIPASRYVGFSCLIGKQLGEAKQLSERLDSIPLFGGPAVTLPLDRDSLPYGCFPNGSYVIRGPGEAVLSKILSGGLKPGCYDGMTTDLPEGRIYPEGGNYTSASIYVGTGCYWGKCSFCNWNKLLVGGGLKYRGWLDIHEEMDGIYSTFPTVESFNLVTESIPKRLTDGIIKEGCDHEWESYMRAEKYFTEQYCQDLADGGCWRMFVGVETGSERMSKVMNKGIGVAQTLQVVKNLHSAEIEVLASVILDHPLETEEDLAETFSTLKEMAPYCQNIWLPKFLLAPGSPVYNNPKDFCIETCLESESRVADVPFGTIHYRRTDNSLPLPVRDFWYNKIVHFLHSCGFSG